MKRQLRKLANYLAQHLLAEDVVYASEDELGSLIDDLMADASTDDLDESDALLVRDCLKAALTKLAAPSGITGYEGMLQADEALQL